MIESWLVTLGSSYAIADSGRRRDRAVIEESRCEHDRTGLECEICARPARQAGEALSGTLPLLESTVADLVASGVTAAGSQQLRDQLLVAVSACSDVLWDAVRPAADDAYLTLAVLHRGITITFGIRSVLYLGGAAEQHSSPEGMPAMDERLQEDLRRELANLRVVAEALSSADPEALDHAYHQAR